MFQINYTPKSGFIAIKLSKNPSKDMLDSLALCERYCTSHLSKKSWGKTKTQLQIHQSDLASLIEHLEKQSRQSQQLNYKNLKSSFSTFNAQSADIGISSIQFHTEESSDRKQEAGDETLDLIGAQLSLAKGILLSIGEDTFIDGLIKQLKTIREEIDLSNRTAHKKQQKREKEAPLRREKQTQDSVWHAIDVSSSKDQKSFIFPHSSKFESALQKFHIKYLRDGKNLVVNKNHISKLEQLPYSEAGLLLNAIRALDSEFKKAYWTVSRQDNFIHATYHHHDSGWQTFTGVLSDPASKIAEAICKIRSGIATSDKSKLTIDENHLTVLESLPYELVADCLNEIKVFQLKNPKSPKPSLVSILFSSSNSDPTQPLLNKAEDKNDNCMSCCCVQ